MASYNTIKGLTVKYLSADPANPEDGQVWYNSGTGNLRVDGMVLAGSWASSTAIPTGNQRMGAAGTSNSSIFIIKVEIMLVILHKLLRLRVIVHLGLVVEL